MMKRTLPNDAALPFESHIQIFSFAIVTEIPILPFVNQRALTRYACPM